jgi:hypothetical protein
MAGLIDILGQTLQGGALQQIAGQLGVDQATAQKAVGMALPALIAGLNRNASSPAGAAALTDALADHDGSILADLGSFLSNHASGPGADILGHVLGGQQSVVQQGVARASGLDAAGAGQLLSMLAPIVMGALGHATQGGSAGPGAVADVISGAHAHVQQAHPDAISVISQLLDSNHDGSALDDIARVGVGLLGGLFASKK